MLGKKVKDCVTGFEGIVTGKAEYLTGCEQYLVVPQTRNRDGELNDSKWFDVDRLQIIGEGITLPQKTSNGPDMPAPMK